MIDTAELRKQAETIAREKAAQSPENLAALSPEETRQALQELRVHQIELEMQNEELRWTQVELEVSRERYFDLYDLAPVGYFTISEKGLILEANLTATTLLGMTRFALVRQPLGRFILKEDQDIYYLHRKQLFETGEPQAYELRMVENGGTIFWARLEANVASDHSTNSGQAAAGAPVCRVVLTDITERKRAEEELRRNEWALNHQNNLFSSLLENLPMGVFMVEAPTGKPLVTNEAAVKILGRGILPDTTANNLAEVYHAYKLDGHVPYPAEELPIVLGMSGKVAHVDDMVVERPDGTRTLLEIFGSPVTDDKGQIWASLVSFFDITERKQAEDKLRGVLEELERSNKDLELFASLASHDLQEPLRMVAGYTQLLAERYAGQLDEKAKKYIAYAKEGATRMQQLVNDLLAYARVGTSDHRVETKDAHSILGQAIGNLAALIEESKAIVTNEELPLVRVNAAQFVQLFQNLLANAVKFRGADFPRIHVSARDEGPEWVFSVRDNGIGIDRKYADRIFVIFQRLHTRQEYPGTGIGLAMCKRIVERHGGRIGFESEPGKGATFFFTVPK
jgi:PAS domain S-box-containing protein